MFAVNKRIKWQRYICYKLKDAQAFSKERAKRLDELEIDESQLLEGLVSKGVIGKEQDKYYLNEEEESRFFQKRRTMVISTILGLVILALLFTLR